MDWNSASTREVEIKSDRIRKASALEKPLGSLGRLSRCPAAVVGRRRCGEGSWKPNRPCGCDIRQGPRGRSRSVEDATVQPGVMKIHPAVVRPYRMRSTSHSRKNAGCRCPETILLQSLEGS